MNSLNFSAALCQFCASIRSRPSRKICIDAVFTFVDCIKRSSFAMSWPLVTLMKANSANTIAMWGRILVIDFILHFVLRDKFEVHRTGTENRERAQKIER